MSSSLVSVIDVESRPDPRALDAAIARSAATLRSQQAPEGNWRFDLEADSSITAEYIMMMHFMDEIDSSIEAKLAKHLRAKQESHGGWGLFYGSTFDLSCSVKAYYALKLAGDAPDAPHMLKAKRAILAHGGAAKANVFTRITLALFDQIPWRGCPFLPVEIVLLPRWFPFHLTKVSYWSRTVMVPLAILCSLKLRARNPRHIGIRELFVTPPELERAYHPKRSTLNRAFAALDALGRRSEARIPNAARRRALLRATRWFIARLNGTDGLGGIFPAMVNAYEALAALGYGYDHPYRVQARDALKKLLVRSEDDTAFCQPCVSPIWDTALATLALQEVGDDASVKAADQALDWCVSKQLKENEPGDWRDVRPGVKGGGWAFQFANPHYPDLDDTSAVAWALSRTEPRRAYTESMASAAEWIVGMQSRNGGFGAFDADNTARYLNQIPFADHGALLDPPTSDVSARCALALTLNGRAEHRFALTRCLAFLRDEQEPAGSWFGRWGTNYVYGTWSVLAALEHAGGVADRAVIARGAAWLKSRQNSDGGWGESNESYWDSTSLPRRDRSTACQTAWGVLGLLAAGEIDSDAVRRGVAFLLARQDTDGQWDDPEFNAPGFPRVFFLKYHGYAKYFPLWALARYRTLARSGAAA